MTAGVFASWYTKPVIVRKAQAEDPGTDVQGWEDPETIQGFVDEQNRLVRNARGAEVVSTVAVYLPIGDADKVNVGSRIELPESQHPDTTVISVATTDIDVSYIDGLAVMCE